MCRYIHVSLFRKVQDLWNFIIFIQLWNITIISSGSKRKEWLWQLSAKALHLLPVGRRALGASGEGGGHGAQRLAGPESPGSLGPGAGEGGPGGEDTQECPDAGIGALPASSSELPLTFVTYPRSRLRPIPLPVMRCTSISVVCNHQPQLVQTLKVIPDTNWNSLCGKTSSALKSAYSIKKLPWAGCLGGSVG